MGSIELAPEVIESTIRIRTCSDHPPAQQQLELFKSGRIFGDSFKAFRKTAAFAIRVREAQQFSCDMLDKTTDQLNAAQEVLYPKHEACIYLAHDIPEGSAFPEQYPFGTTDWIKRGKAYRIRRYVQAMTEGMI